MSELADLLRERFPEVQVSSLARYLQNVQDEADRLPVRIDGSKTLLVAAPMEPELVAFMRNRLIDHVGLQYAVDRSHSVITEMARAHKEVARKRPNAFQPGVTQEVLLFHRHYLQQLALRGAAAMASDNLVTSLHRKFEVLSVNAARPSLTWPVAMTAGEYLLEAELRADGPSFVDTTMALDQVIAEQKLDGFVKETSVSTPAF